MSVEVGQFPISYSNSTQMVSLFEQVLALPAGHISATANFFHLGAHSLHAAQLAARIRQRWRVDIGVRDVFGSPTARQLASDVVSHIGANNSAPPPASSPAASLPLFAPESARPAHLTAAPLSHAQSRVWFMVCPSQWYEFTRCFFRNVCNQGQPCIIYHLVFACLGLWIWSRYPWHSEPSYSVTTACGHALLNNPTVTNLCK